MNVDLTQICVAAINRLSGWQILLGLGLLLATHLLVKHIKNRPIRELISKVDTGIANISGLVGEMNETVSRIHRDHSILRGDISSVTQTVQGIYGELQRIIRM